MKKTKKSKGLDIIPIKNPVAKFARQFNKATVFKDKTQYRRKAKHKGKEPFPMMSMTVLEKASCYKMASVLPINTQYTSSGHGYGIYKTLIFVGSKMLRQADSKLRNCFSNAAIGKNSGIRNPQLWPGEV